MSILSPSVEPSPPNKAFATRDDQGEVSTHSTAFLSDFCLLLACCLAAVCTPYQTPLSTLPTICSFLAYFSVACWPTGSLLFV
jgi:hypothetical protein